MKALTGNWMLATPKHQHTWIAGKDYKIRDNGDKILITSEAGTEAISKDKCDPSLFLAVFGMRI